MTIGRWRRSRVARSTIPSPRMGRSWPYRTRSRRIRRGGRSGPTASWCWPRNDWPAARALGRAIGHDHAARALRGEVSGAEFDHLAGADEQRAGLAQIAEHALGQAHGGGGHGHRLRADGGLRPHFLATEKVRWNIWCSSVPSEPASPARARRPSSGPRSGSRPAPWNPGRWPRGRRDARRRPGDGGRGAGAGCRRRAGCSRPARPAAARHMAVGRAIDLGAVTGREDGGFADRAAEGRAQSVQRGLTRSTGMDTRSRTETGADV